ncbi:hypothetical protein GCM10010435_19110 [Winogradskya consettensis]|uniref:Uncharacterized protein n=1 Tax=Winogradskya consettensis TaxID=113560 RepID=A0A919STP5_9ACTN|nr:hypothetical protein Aco04nite_59940 [Actinoplanes consettensis]
MPPQLVPAGSQSLHVRLKLPGHPVERPRQLPDLIPPPHRHPHTQLPVSHLARSPGKLLQRTRSRASQPPRGKNRQPRHRKNGYGKKHVQNRRLLGPHLHADRKRLTRLNGYPPPRRTGNLPDSDLNTRRAAVTKAPDEKPIDPLQSHHNNVVLHRPRPDRGNRLPHTAALTCANLARTALRWATLHWATLHWATLHWATLHWATLGRDGWLPGVGCPRLSSLIRSRTVAFTDGPTRRGGGGAASWRDANLGRQPAGNHLVGSGPLIGHGQHGNRVRDSLELSAHRSDRRPHRRYGMIKSLCGPVPAHRGNGHPDKEGSEQDRTEHDREEGSSESATQSHISSWKWPSLERC